MDDVIKGTGLKLNIHIEPIDGLTMDNYDFVCVFHNPSRSDRISYSKSDMARADKDNYIVVVDTSKFSECNLLLSITALIPDADCKDGFRCEKITMNTGFKII